MNVDDSVTGGCLSASLLSWGSVPHAVHRLTLAGTSHTFASEFLHTQISVSTASAPSNMPWHPDVFASDVASGGQVTLNKPDLWSLVLHGASPAAIYTDNLIVPAYVAATSAALLVLHILLIWTPVRRFISQLQKNKNISDNNREPQPTTQAFGILAEVREHVAFHGGPTIFFYMVFRFLGSLALLGLSVTSLVLDEHDRTHDNVGLYGKWGKKTQGEERTLCFHERGMVGSLSMLDIPIHIFPCSHCSDGKTQM